MQASHRLSNVVVSFIIHAAEFHINVHAMLTIHFLYKTHRHNKWSSIRKLIRMPLHSKKMKLEYELHHVFAALYS